MPIYTATVKTPVGSMIAGASDQGLCLFDFEHRKGLASVMQRIAAFMNDSYTAAPHPLHERLREQIEAYFNGNSMVFDLPLLLAGSPFQIKVWKGLQAIPYGRTSTYKQQARHYGDEKAMRAIAGANGANGIAIIVPCHRVIGSNGSLTGYSGGTAHKKWLLAHEQSHSNVNGQISLF